MDSNPKYPWQQSVVDALTEMNPDHLAQKVATAEEVIAARLCDSPDSLEQRALRNALTAIKMLRLSPEK